MFKLASVFSLSQQPQVAKMQPAQVPTPSSPVSCPSSSRRKQPTSSQKPSNLKQQKKQPSQRNCSNPFSVTPQETASPFHGKNVAGTTPTKKITILKRGEPIPIVRAAPSKFAAEQVPSNTQKGPKKTQRRKRDYAKNSLSAWSEPLTGDEACTTAPRLNASSSEPNGLSDKVDMAEFKRSNSAELPVSRFEDPHRTEGKTKQQDDERNSRQEGSKPRATPRKNRRGDRRKKDSAGAILNSEIDAMDYIASHPLARVGESSDSDALASSPPVHNEHGLDFSLSSLVNSPSKSYPTANTTRSNNHKSVMLKQTGGNGFIMLLAKTSRPSLQIWENNTNKSTTRRRNTGKSVDVHEVSTKLLSTSVPESNSGLMRSPLTNVTSVQQMGTTTPSKQRRRRELFTLNTMPGAEPAHSGGPPFIRRRRSVSSVDDHPQDLSMTTPARPKSQLYAGPTFHNSPTPSSLPVPAFMKFHDQK